MKIPEPVTDFSKLEVVPPGTSKEAVIEESNRRAARCGYCTIDGLPPYRTRIMITSGWGERRLNVWPRDENGNLIE